MGAPTDNFLQEARSISQQLKKVETKAPVIKEINKLIEKTIYLSAEAQRFLDKVDYVQGVFVTPEGIFRTVKNPNGKETYEFVRKLSLVERRRLRGLSENFIILSDKLAKIQMPGDKYEGRKLIPGELRARLYSMILDAKRAYKELAKRGETGSYVTRPPSSFLLRTSIKNSMRLFIKSLSQELKDVLADIENQRRYGPLPLSADEKRDIVKLKDILDSYIIEGGYLFLQRVPFLPIYGLILYLLFAALMKLISQGVFIGWLIISFIVLFAGLVYRKRQKKQSIMKD